MGLLVSSHCSPSGRLHSILKESWPSRAGELRTTRSSLVKTLPKVYSLREGRSSQIKPPPTVLVRTIWGQGGKTDIKQVMSTKCHIHVSPTVLSISTASRGLEFSIAIELGFLFRCSLPTPQIHPNPLFWTCICIFISQITLQKMRLLINRHIIK